MKPYFCLVSAFIISMSLSACGSGGSGRIKDARDIELSSLERNLLKSTAAVIRQIGNGGWSLAFETAVQPLALELRIAKSMLGDEGSVTASGTPEAFPVYFPCLNGTALFPLTGEVTITGEYPNNYALTTHVSEGSLSNCRIYDSLVSSQNLVLTTETTNFKKENEKFSGSHSFKLSGEFLVSLAQLSEGLSESQVETRIIRLAISGSYQISQETIQKRWASVSDSILENGECQGSVTILDSGEEVLKVLSCSEFFKSGLSLLRNGTNYDYADFE